MPDNEVAVATAQVALEPQVVFPVLVDLDTAPSWSSVEIARLAVPDGALHEGDRFPATVALGEWKVDLRFRVARLERPVAVGYELFYGEVLMLRLIQHLTPVTGGIGAAVLVCSRRRATRFGARPAPSGLSLQRFLAVLEPIAHT